ncbi:unnamed protein product [Cylindrotheca closterium]|uniref:Uncharacterized protein n=1 Tax=Cylindrotheca closterium TaxID=2856 RepID=A0AAD2FBU7_9STRA|nr:unnamed protein product [Cylindrotheca closterium]
MTTSIVRIGPMTTMEVSSAQLLRTALVSHWKQHHPSPEEQGETSADENKLLPISNKYFTANLLLEDMEAEANEAIKEDAAILVFDMLASNPDRSGGVPGTTFNSLQAVHDQALAKDTCGDLLRLCVGVTLTSLSPQEARGEKHEDEYSRRILWCLDHGYEYVEADLSQEGQTKGHDDRDKDGFARIVEAMQGTVWSGAVMKERQATKLQASYDQDANDIKKQDDDNENPYVPPDPSLLMAIPKDGESPTSAPSTPNRTAEMERLRQEIDEDKVFDEMETVLREASRIREQSKCGQLTDDERRAKAESAALRLVDLMNHFGMEDEGGEGEDGGSIADSDDSGIVASSS